MKKINVLLVDDDLDDQEIFKEALQKVDPDIHIEFADNGIEAVKKLESGDGLPDVIFSDINMPLMNGTQLLEEIKKSNVLNGIPVVMYTTSSSTFNKAQSKALGALHYIVKPTCFDKICSEISFALSIISGLSRTQTVNSAEIAASAS